MWRAMCTDACRKRITCTITRVTVFSLTNRFHVAVRLFSNKSQMTSKCDKNKKVAQEPLDFKLTYLILMMGIIRSGQVNVVSLRAK